MQELLSSSWQYPHTENQDTFQPSAQQQIRLQKTIGLELEVSTESVDFKLIAPPTKQTLRQLQDLKRKTGRGQV